MTSLNSVVISVRLVIAIGIQYLLAITVKEAGIAKIGQLRNIIAIITSTSMLGVFNGVVKYVAQYKEDEETLQKVFSTAFVFGTVGGTATAIFLFFWADFLSLYTFGNTGFNFVFKILAACIPFLVMFRIFHGIVNGLSDYKKFAKIDLFSYLLAIIVLLFGLYYYSINGVLVAIAITPIIQFFTLIVIFSKVLKKYIVFKDLEFKVPYLKSFLVFAVMSFVSTVLINLAEIDIRTTITNRININEAAYWTAVSNISKNYMVFSSAIFTLYVIPKFSTINSANRFVKEVLHIYKTLMPLFAIGMLLIFVFRDYVIKLIYPDFIGMEPLFKWQLLGDFIRLLSLVLGHQFLAKKMLKTFVVTELVSLSTFYFLSTYLVGLYGAEGVVMAHFYRYILYLIIVVIALYFYFKKKEVLDNKK